jgi:membrane protease YdiL (CAAX protease family)
MAKRRGRSSQGSAEVLKYLQESMRPLVILAFLAPLALFYHFASGPYRANLVAFGLLEQTARLFGVYGRSVPLVLLVLILLGWHLARHDRWQFRLSTVSLMAAESIVLALPLFLLGLVGRYWLPLVARGSVETLGRDLALAAGAGVYEELVFRFLLCGLLMLLLARALALPKPWPVILTIIISAFCFSIYHYVGAESFAWSTFTFRLLAGAYLAGVYLYRGLGISAGVHAFYDVVLAIFVGF